jgi:hypothetical protein
VLVDKGVREGDNYSTMKCLEDRCGTLLLLSLGRLGTIADSDDRAFVVWLHNIAYSFESRDNSALVWIGQNAANYNRHVDTQSRRAQEQTSKLEN